MSRSYSMQAVSGAADQAALLCHTLLRWLDPSSQVHDVQLDPRFQHRGVDLLWQRGEAVTGVEVKGDRQGRRGNYFLELVSNVEKDTPGCFLYTTADLLAYAFLDLGEVHALPVAKAREWFLPRARGFALRRTQTQTGPARYTTVGALVPVAQLAREVEGVRRFRRQLEGFTELGRPKTPTSRSR
jgi:hypothetical protein